jgi:hypothetical protein
VEEEKLPFSSRYQLQQTRTAPYTTATYKHFKPEKPKATQNKIIKKCKCTSSSSFADYSEIQI